MKVSISEYNMAHLDKIIIYINKTRDGGWLKKLDEYAKCNDWSISKAVRKLLAAFLNTNIPTEKPTYISPDEKEIKRINDTITTEKIDPDTYFAQVESKLVKAETGDIDRQVEECVKSRLDKDGKVSCYFRDNGREYHTFCKQYCWPRVDVWGDRAVK